MKDRFLPSGWSMFNRGYPPPINPNGPFCKIGEVPDSLPDNWEHAMNRAEFGTDIPRWALRTVVDSGIQLTSPIGALAVARYHRAQERLVAVTGGCDGLCDQSHWMELNGQTVCRRTRLPCPWNQDKFLAVVRLFDWNNTIDFEGQKI